MDTCSPTERVTSQKGHIKTYKLIASSTMQLRVRAITGRWSEGSLVIPFYEQLRKYNLFRISM